MAITFYIIEFPANYEPFANYALVGVPEGAQPEETGFTLLDTPFFGGAKWFHEFRFAEKIYRAKVGPGPMRLIRYGGPPRREVSQSPRQLRKAFLR